MKYLLFITLLLQSVASWASPGKDVAESATQKMAGRPFYFLENKGQVTDQYGGARTDVQYSLALEGAIVFIGDGRLHYQFSDAGNKKVKGRQNKAINTYRLDVTLAGANNNAVCTAEGEQSYFEQYYVARAGMDGVIARSYRKIVYREIYPGIDWVLYTANGALKYDFIVHAGADPAQIRLQYDGATSLTLRKNGALAAKTPKGTVAEMPPYSYYQATGKELPVHFTVHGNTAGFDIGIQKKTFVIDPAVRLWGTYFGGHMHDYAYCIATDTAGNVYMGGSTSNWANIASAGSHQDISGTNGSSNDGFLVKFSPTGSRLWATYYGGTEQDEILDITCDRMGNVFVSGHTQSSTHMATPGSHKPAYNPSYLYRRWNAFLAKFNSAGVRQWGTYYGDSLTTEATALACDASGNVYMAGSTWDSVGISTPGAFQSRYMGADGYVVKFSPAGQRIWGSYYGGTGEDGINGLCYDAYTNSVYLGGSTQSTTGIATTGAFQPNRTSSGPNSSDGFLMNIDTAGRKKWGTYYGGYGTNAVSVMTTDAKGFVYFTGGFSTAPHMTSPGAFMTSSPDAQNVLLAKFDTGGKRVWATYLGGLSIGLGIATDAAGNVLLAGTTGDRFFLSTPGAFQEIGNAFTSTSNPESFLMKISPDGQRIWGTYYGTPHKDYGNGLAYHKGNNSTYICGGTIPGSATNAFFGTPGSWQPTALQSGYFESFLARFSNDTVAYISLPFNDLPICAGSALNIPYGSDTFNSGNVFSIQLSNASGHFNGGTAIIGTATATTGGIMACTIPVGTTPGGYYKIRVLASNPADTSQPVGKDVTINAPFTGLTAGGSNGPICERDLLSLTASFSGAGPVTHYDWTGPNGFHSQKQNPNITTTTPLASGIYIVTAMQGRCAATPDTLTVLVKPAPDSATVTVNSPVCLGDTLHLAATCPTPGVLFAWTGPSFTDTGAYVYLPSVQLSQGGSYQATAYLNGCPSIPVLGATSGKVVVVNNINAGPGVSVMVNPGLTFSAGTPVTFRATVNNGGTAPAYQWLNNGLAIAGETSAIFTSSKLAENDMISVVVRSSEICARPDSVLSMPLTVHVVSTGVANAFAERNIRVYPSPNNGTFTVNGTLTINEDALIDVIDFTGKVVYNHSVEVSNRKIDARISLGAGITPGLYILRITQSGIQTRTVFSVL